MCVGIGKRLWVPGGGEAGQVFPQLSSGNTSTHLSLALLLPSPPQHSHLSCSTIPAPPLSGHRPTSSWETGLTQHFFFSPPLPASYSSSLQPHTSLYTSGPYLPPLSTSSPALPLPAIPLHSAVSLSIRSTESSTVLPPRLCFWKPHPSCLLLPPLNATPAAEPPVCVRVKGEIPAPLTPLGKPSREAQLEGCEAGWGGMLGGEERGQRSPPGTPTSETPPVPPLRARLLRAGGEVSSGSGHSSSPPIPSSGLGGGGHLGVSFTSLLP